MDAILPHFVEVITLPLFVTIILGAVVGIKPDTFIKPSLEALGAVVTGFFKLLCLGLRETGRAITAAAAEHARQCGDARRERR